MFGDDLRLALLHRGPVEFARFHAFDAEFFRVSQLVPEFGVKQQGLGRNAAHVQAGAAEQAVFFDHGRFQTVLAGADRGRISRRAAADDRDVINGFGQRELLT